MNIYIIYRKTDISSMIPIPIITISMIYDDIFDTSTHEWFAKAQNRSANYFIRQIVPDSLQRRFRSVTLCSFGVAPETSLTWLPTRGSRGGSGLDCLVAVLVNEDWAVLPEPFLLFSCEIRS